jgi:hypothetical protein
MKPQQVRASTNRGQPLKDADLLMNVGGTI